MEKEKSKRIKELLKEAEVLSKELLKENVIDSPAVIYSRVKKYAIKKQEHFIVVGLGAGNQIEYVEVSTIGVQNRSLVGMREIFKKAIVKNCSSLIIVHNHPGGSLEQSPEDKAVTKRVKECGDLLGIPLLDSIIISRYGFSSQVDS